MKEFYGIRRIITSVGIRINNPGSLCRHDAGVDRRAVSSFLRSANFNVHLSGDLKGSVVGTIIGKENGPTCAGILGKCSAGFVNQVFKRAAFIEAGKDECGGFFGVVQLFNVEVEVLELSPIKFHSHVFELIFGIEIEMLGR